MAYNIRAFSEGTQQWRNCQTAEFWQAHIEAWKRSGLTQIAYCANNQWHIKSFGRRLSQERIATQAHHQATKSLTLIPISLGTHAL